MDTSVFSTSLTKNDKNRSLLSRCNHNLTRNLQLALGIVFNKSDNADSMGMLNPSKGV